MAQKDRHAWYTNYNIKKLVIKLDNLMLQAKISSADQEVTNTRQNKYKSHKDNRATNTSIADPHTNTDSAQHKVRHEYGCFSFCL